MPTPSHRPNTFKANRVFTDRDEARDLFAQQCAAQQHQNEYRVLNFYGVGGQGKSALCGQFEKHLDSLPNNEDHQLAWAKINFEDSNKRNPIAALMALRLQLAANGKLWFPAFDTAFARYFAITQAGRNLETSYPELFKQPHDLLQGLAATAEALSGLPLLGKALERLHKADEKRILQRWMETRGTELLAGLEGFSAYKLEDELPSFFGADVDDWLHNETNAPQRRVVFLYDTYEALWRDQPSKTDLLVDKWVRKLVNETPAVLHVILGRETLAWAQQDPEEWQGIITPCPLDHLTDTDADNFLQSIPVVENDIRAQIMAGAKGIPFYLNLQVDQYESCKRRNLTPQADEYGGKEPEMLARFISHLPDMTRRALRLASYPRWLDEILFLNLCEKFLGGAAVISLHELTAYSFWTKQENRYFLHAVMRDYLQAESLEHEATLYRNIHQHLFDHYDNKLQALTSASKLTEGHSEALIEGAYHLEAVDCPKIPYWVGKYREKFHLAGQWITLEPLLALSLQISREIGDKKSEGAVLNNISQIYDARGDYDTALDFLKKSLAITQEIGDKSGEGATLGNMATTAYARGDYDTTLDFLKKSLAIQQKIGDKSGEGTTLNNMATTAHARGYYDTALDFLKKSLAITQEIGDKSGEGTTLNNISQIYSARGDYDTA
ncbi:MAG: tetratricopeptide repeat protein, partial [Thiothrix sp.]|uniref:tetratricopeptide repeat protein n=1 Tax=Thiothrix sp. TaxID=1032 RepID=UPI00263104C9